MAMGSRRDLKRNRNELDRAVGHEPKAKQLTRTLAGLLVESWSLAEIGAKTVQQLAKAAFDDGSAHPDLVKLAGLGPLEGIQVIAAGAWSLH